MGESSPPPFALENQSHLNMSRAVKRKARSKFPPIDYEDVTRFIKVLKIGEGRYGQIHKVYDKYTQCDDNPSRFYTLKKLLLRSEQQLFTSRRAFREVKLLRYIQHENIISLIHVCRSPVSIISNPNQVRRELYLLLDFVEHDLAGLLSNAQFVLTPEEIKDILLQLTGAMHYLHHMQIMHRDIKPANILITRDGVVKLGDFGLARKIHRNRRHSNKENFRGNPKIESEPKKGYKPLNFTDNLTTLWYRAPELLLGEINYGTEIDMWAYGCVASQMWTRRALMAGSDHEQQLGEIIRLCGSFTRDVWPNITTFHIYKQLDLPRKRRRQLLHYLKPILKDDNACDLINKALALDPRRRIKAQDALSHKYFKTGERPVNVGPKLGLFQEHMLDYLVKEKEEESISVTTSSEH